MKNPVHLPHPLFDAAIAWSGIAVHLSQVNQVLSTIALSMTVIASGLGIYTAYRNIKRMTK